MYGIKTHDMLKDMVEDTLAGHFKLASQNCLTPEVLERLPVGSEERTTELLLLRPSLL